MGQPNPLDHKPRRGHARLRVGIPAQLECFDGLKKVTLVDLSQGGARLVVGTTDRISGGVLRWLNFETFGETVRQRGEELAMRFDEPIDLDWVIATRQWLPAEQKAEQARNRQAAREWIQGRR